MEDAHILNRVQELVNEEHGLRERTQAGTITLDEEQQRLHQLEESLDQCWDLLRRRRAQREAGQDPESLDVRNTGTVEGYQQ